ncbi:MAG: hypothetical protein N3A58_03565, partial [Spirochaetes bacterium]|nr:hypothetical protein [Spirochaetota bacterium]
FDIFYLELKNISKEYSSYNEYINSSVLKQCKTNLRNRFYIFYIKIKFFIEFIIKIFLNIFLKTFDLWKDFKINRF